MIIYLTQKNTNHQIAELPINFFEANETISEELIIYPAVSYTHLRAHETREEME